jgi:hypothetical protein
VRAEEGEEGAAGNDGDGQDGGDMDMDMERECRVEEWTAMLERKNNEDLSLVVW